MTGAAWWVGVALLLVVAVLVFTVGSTSPATRRAWPIRAWLARTGWVRCGCGLERVAPGTITERGGVAHRADGPCYRCDVFGRPL